MTSPLQSILSKRDVACSRCGYNLRGLRDTTCPECGSAIDISAITPRPAPPITRRFQSSRAAAALGCAIGPLALLYETPRAWRLGTDYEATIVTMAGLGALAIGMAWLIYANRIAHARPAIQGRIAMFMWIALVILTVIAIGTR